MKWPDRGLRRTVLGIVWLASLFILAAVSLPPDGFRKYGTTDGLLHFAVHAASYALLAFSATLLVRGGRFYAAICLIVFLGVYLEWLQSVKYVVRLEVFDVIANLLGTFSGVLLSKIVRPVN
jgi:hypothetical protein